LAQYGAVPMQGTSFIQSGSGAGFMAVLNDIEMALLAILTQTGMAHQN
jgi:hypothetical protein